MSTERDDYEIVARIRAEDLVGGGTRSAERKLIRVERLGTRVGGTITRALGGAFAALGGGMLFGGAIRGVIGLNQELEQANIGMATLLNGIAQIPMADAIGLARSQVVGLRKDAAEGVGELSDYMSAFQMLLGPGLTGGASLEQLRTLTRTSLATGFAQRGTAGLQQAPMDIVQALTSGVNDRQTPIALSALQAINVEASKFNRLGTADKIVTLTRAFGAFGEGVALMGQTWDAQMGTMKDGVRGLLQQLTEPLYDRWSEQLRAANSWLDEHRDGLEIIVNRWGQRLVQVWDSLISKAGTYAAIVSAAAVLPVLPAAGAVAGRAAVGAAAGAGLLRRNVIGVAAGSMLASRVAGGGLAGAAAGGGVMLRGLLAGLGRLLLPISRLLWPVALLTTLFISVKGALSEFPGLLTFLQGAWASLMLSLDQLAASFGLLGGRGSLLNLVGAVLVGVLGGLLYAFSFGVKVISTLTTGIATFFRVLGGALQGLYNAVLRREDPFATMTAAATEGKKMLTDIWSQWKPPEIPTVGGDGSEGSDGLTVPTHITNINGPVHVEIKTETMDDPARVGATIEEVIGRIRRNRVQGRRGTGPVLAGA